MTRRALSGSAVLAVALSFFGVFGSAALAAPEQSNPSCTGSVVSSVAPNATPFGQNFVRPAVGSQEPPETTFGKAISAEATAPRDACPAPPG